MNIKKFAIIAMLMVSALALASCTSKPAASTATTVPVETAAAADELELTLEELAQYDGTDGNPAYVAIDGIIYDVTGVEAWTGGTHNGNTAGKDLTEAIKNSPHGQSVLEGLPAVGKIK
jgi:predicted heme/steroid binding protein